MTCCQSLNYKYYSVVYTKYCSSINLLLWVYYDISIFIFKQLIHEFTRYQEIIRRPKIYAQLKGELENFLNCLKQIINAMCDNVDGENVQKTNVFELAGLEPIVRNIYSLKQQEAKVHNS